MIFSLDDIPGNSASTSPSDELLPITHTNRPLHPARLFPPPSASVTQLTPFDIFVALLLAAFSCWLMWHTFSYYPQTNSFGIAHKVWSDFASHIPLIRSFSLGSNWPPEYPLYPGEPIRYHFLYYFLVGKLEGLGVRIDYALNTLSALGFFTMCYLAYRVSLMATASRRASVLALLFLLFNGSLSFDRYFSKVGWSLNSLLAIPHLREFVSFAPWGDGDIAAFWSLTIFTNQRHLAWGYAITLSVLHRAFLFHQGRRSDPYGWGLVHGIMISLLPFFHQPTLLLVAITMAVTFLFLPRARLYLFLAGIFALLPVGYQITQLLPVAVDGSTGRGFSWHPGYLSPYALTFIGLATYWFHNIGLHLFLAPFGAILGGVELVVLGLIALIMFLVGNLFQFSIEMAANHKLFNFAIIIAGMMSGVSLVKLWDTSTLLLNRFPMTGATLRQAVVAAFLLLIASGLIEIMPIVNDRPYPYDDMVPGSPAAWIRDNTPRDAKFLNSSFTFHPASVAGRAIYQGWPYFTWSNGYPNRTGEMEYFYNLRDPHLMCQFLNERALSYFTVERVLNDPNLPDIDPAFYERLFSPDYVSADRSYSIYSAASVCAVALAKETSFNLCPSLK